MYHVRYRHGHLWVHESVEPTEDGMDAVRGPRILDRMCGDLHDGYVDEGTMFQETASVFGFQPSATGLGVVADVRPLEHPALAGLESVCLTLLASIGEAFVATGTVSSKYQIVIPKDVRDRLRIEPGQKVEAFAIGGRIELVPVRPIAEMRGFLRGIPDFEREPDREL